MIDLILEYPLTTFYTSLIFLIGMVALQFVTESKELLKHKPSGPMNNIYFNDAGTKLMVCDNNEITEYNLSTPMDFKTATISNVEK